MSALHSQLLQVSPVDEPLCCDPLESSTLHGTDPAFIAEPDTALPRTSRIVTNASAIASATVFLAHLAIASHTQSGLRPELLICSVETPMWRSAVLHFTPGDLLGDCCHISHLPSFLQGDWFKWQVTNYSSSIIAYLFSFGALEWIPYGLGTFWLFILSISPKMHFNII